MLNFCTLFDSNYMARGLAMYDSLMKHCKDFHLYIFAFDEQSYQYLKSNAHQYPQTTAIPLATFEDPALLSVKPLRTTAEYCWTCTPSTIAYCIKTFQLNHCTYLDADMLFYSDPSTLINEMKEKSVLISEHRYTREYDQSSYSGIYCVQFMTFKNTEEGMHVLNWWREKCIEWCYARLEDGKFGDQKYLDDWPQRFDSVHVLQNKGAGIAPWNMQQYDFLSNDTARYLPDGRQCEIVFVHFHGLKFYSNDNLT
ncbi:MAG: glycosyl transferase, partial [Gemmatimonadaceae bacterium]|nr:glycosyl transferase [Chitinophagaceae bacterium]